MEVKVEGRKRDTAQRRPNNNIETDPRTSSDGRGLLLSSLDSRGFSDDPQTEEQDDLNRSRGRRLAANIGVGLLLLGILVGVWWAVAVISNSPPYILPTPPTVAERIWSMLLDGSLLFHAFITIRTAGLGFLLAFLIGVGLAYPIARSPRLERLVSPYIALSQGLPVVAIAPLLIIWVKDDLARKVIIVALIVFFPILVNTIVGLRSIDRSMLEVARISGANFVQTLRYVELPLSLRALLGGLKLGLTLSITGAIIGEFVAPRSGLGFLLVLGQNLFDTPLIFVGLVSIATLSVLAYVGLTVLERTLIDWE